MTQPSMPYELQVTPSLLTMHLTGTLTPNDLHELAARIAHLEETLAITPDRITHLDQVTDVALDYTAMDGFTLRRQQAPIKNPIKSAIIAPKDLHFGFARMFQQLGPNPLITVQVFRTEAEARDWLGLASAAAGRENRDPLSAGRLG